LAGRSLNEALLVSCPSRPSKFFEIQAILAGNFGHARVGDDGSAVDAKAKILGHDLLLHLVGKVEGSQGGGIRRVGGVGKILGIITSGLHKRSRSAGKRALVQGGIIGQNSDVQIGPSTIGAIGMGLGLVRDSLVDIHAQLFNVRGRDTSESTHLVG